MKQTFLTLLVILAFLACKNEDSEPKLEKTYPGLMDTGFLEGVRAGEYWQSTAFAEYSIFDSTYVGFSCFTYSTGADNRELLTLGEIPLKVGKYPIKGGNAISAGLDGFVGAQYGWAEDDGDVFGASYNHDDENSAGYLEVTYVDYVAKRILGTFDRMIFKNRLPQSPYPKQVVFEKGKFDMKITQ